jgi:hypothetical protein
MIASEQSCTCHECGVVCRGRFRGCADVWAKGPVDPGIVEMSRHYGDQGAGHAVRSLEDRADLFAEVVQVVEARVTALGRRLEEEEEKRLQSLLHEINLRLDGLAQPASGSPQPKPGRRRSRVGNGAVGRAEPGSDQAGPPRRYPTE